MTQCTAGWPDMVTQGCFSPCKASSQGASLFFTPTRTPTLLPRTLWGAHTGNSKLVWSTSQTPEQES